MEKLVRIRKPHGKTPCDNHFLPTKLVRKRHFTEVLFIRHALHPQFAARASVHPSWFGTFDILAGFFFIGLSAAKSIGVWNLSWFSHPFQDTRTLKQVEISLEIPASDGIYMILKRCFPSHASQFSIGHNPS